MTSTLQLQDSNVYQARIIDQMISTTEQGDTRLILTIMVTARLRNPKDSSAGSEVCPPMEREVWITFPANDENRLRIAISHMERLGFTDDDISRLHPEHPDCNRLVEKEIYVRHKLVGDREYWNLAWPREMSGLDQTKEIAALVKTKIAALRQKGQKNETGKAPSPGRVGP